MAEKSADSDANPVESSEFNLLYSPSVGHDIEVSEEPEQSSTKGRKRTRNPENWKKKYMKRPGLRKNAPIVVLSEKTECCKKNCIQKFGIDHLKKLRSAFQELFYDQQNIYLNGLLHCHTTKKSSGHPRKNSPCLSSNGKKIGRTPAEASQFSFKYSIRDSKGINVTVCQKAFCTVHGFGPRRLQVLRRKMESGTLEPDRRGKHSNHVKVDENIKELIRDHIKSYPSRQSHYSRKDNSDRVYLPAEFSIARLHREFLETYDPEYIQLEKDNQERRMRHEEVIPLRKPMVSEHLYHDLFVTEFNIHFGFPRTDSCGTCDGLQVQLDAANEPEKSQLERELEAHQKLAQEGYSAYRYDRELSKASWANKTVAY